MEKKESFQKIFQLLKNVVEQIDCLSKYPDTIPQIEIDITKNNLQYIYEFIQQLENRNNQISNVETKNNSQLSSNIEERLSSLLQKTEQLNVDTKKIVENPAKSEINSENSQIKGNLVSSNFSSLNQIKEEVKKEIETPKKEELNQIPIVKQTEIKEVEKVKDVIKPVEQKKTKEIIIEKQEIKPTTQTIGENIRDEKVLVNDKLMDAGNDNTIAGKLQRKSLKDIKSAIGINDKILIIKEIFNGNADKYSEFINLINNAHSKDEAMGILANYQSENSWDTELGSYQFVVNIINRKF